MKIKYIPFSCLPLNIIGLRPSSKLYLSHIMHELFATGCEETMFNIVLNMHELFDAGRNETMFEIVLNIHELFAAWGEETVFEFVLNRHEPFATGSEETMFEIVLNVHELFGPWGEETIFEIVLNIHELFGAWSEIFFWDCPYLFDCDVSCIIVTSCPVLFLTLWPFHQGDVILTAMWHYLLFLFFILTWFYMCNICIWLQIV